MDRINNQKFLFESIDGTYIVRNIHHEVVNKNGRLRPAIVRNHDRHQILNEMEMITLLITKALTVQKACLAITSDQNWTDYIFVYKLDDHKIQAELK